MVRGASIPIVPPASRLSGRVARRRAGPEHLIVRQLMPGVRDKIPMADEAGGTLLDTMPDDEALLLALWQSDGRRVTPATLSVKAAEITRLSPEAVQ